ncbi:MAG: DUF1349 domain-containing protein [Anaerolineaceae bacterium]|nr:MAG: DUF1349 domain-containing protein [Anaerolineaceae bacterium]
MKYPDSKQKQQNRSQAETLHGRSVQGQSLVEYALIAVLIGLALGLGLASTQDAVSRVFERTVYSLLGEEPERRDGGGPADFWLTVTWVAENPPEQRRLPTRTLAPASATPTEIPSSGDDNGDNGDNGEPTVEPPTPQPSPTPLDIGHHAPWVDTADNQNWYRLGSPAFLGYSPWFADYYSGTNFNEFIEARPNGDLYGQRARFVLDFPNPIFNAWQTADNAPFADANNQFSARFQRRIYVPPHQDDDTETQPVDLQFNVTASDGVRVWLLPQIGPNEYDSPGCTGCQVINEWTNGLNSVSVPRSVTPGMYMLQVDYYNNGGDAILQLDISTTRNPDDAQITGNADNFTVVDTTSQCNWGLRTTDDSNSLDRLWDKHSQGDLAQNTVCYLELRGFITVPNELPDPVFVFWDVWDLAAGHGAWLEIAEYTALPDAPFALDRDAIQWQRIDIHSGGTRNYNWTRHEVDLSAFSGRNVTFRFAQLTGGANDRLWHIDDIEVKSGTNGEFTAEPIGPDTLFELSSPSDAASFITTGQWQLTGNNTRPGSTCCSWELRPGGAYTGLSTAPTSPNAAGRVQENMRVHYVQIVPMIDTTLSTEDRDGDTGPPVLSFWHAYDVDRYVGLEVQYRAEGSDEWLVVPGAIPDEPAGRLLDVTNNNDNASRDNNIMRPMDVTLQYIVDANGDPIERYHLRFAMLVHGLSPATGHGDFPSVGAGWWIDDIDLHREGDQRFLDYPFYDAAEQGVDNWLATGTWWRTTEESRVGAHSFADSPNGNFQANTGSPNDSLHLMTAHPIDLNNDTPNNLDAALNPDGRAGNTGGMAENPYLTFWHKRFLTDQASIHVEWRRVDEDDTEWKPLWAYRRGMGYHDDWESRTRVNAAWEYTRISLQPILDQLVRPGDADYDPDGDLTADDIHIRFRLENSSTEVDRGWFIDDIRLEEYSETSFRLWSGPSNDFGQGQDVMFNASPDSFGWSNTWRLGGDWQRTNIDSHSGVFSFHESVGSDTQAPSHINDPYTRTRTDTYNILELQTIIDMRATDATLEPTLYFWSRFYARWSDRMRVQVSYELRPDEYSAMEGRCRGGVLAQCFERDWGWSRWYDASTSASQNNSLYASWDSNASGDRRTFSWQRWQVDLTSIRINNSNRVYLVPHDGDPGRRIRIRFLFDALSGNETDKRDGWYIDTITIEPRRNLTIARIADQPFLDDANNMFNWVGEGGWGIDPSVSLRTTEGITALGSWTESWWDMTPDCNNNNPRGLGTEDTCVGYLFDNDDFTNAPLTRIVSQVNYNMGQGSPRTGIPNDFFAGQWVLNTPQVGAGFGIEPGEYRFTATADDGMRMRWQEIDAAGNVIANQAGSWNIINRWQNQGDTTRSGTVNFEEGKRYRLTLQYYEWAGGATIVLSVDQGNTFSFADTPRLTSDPSQPDEPPLRYANSSLISDGTFDLSNTVNPVLEYKTAYKMRCDSTLRVEISTDGGFSWGQSNLGRGSFDNPNINNNTRLPDDPFGWRVVRHDLSDYEGQEIMVRFRLDRQNTPHLNDRNGCGDNPPANTSGYYIGAWLTDIIIAPVGVLPPPDPNAPDPTPEPEPEPIAWSSQNIGSGQTGNVVEDNGTFTITTLGGDIWGSTDRFHYMYTPLSGDGEIIARVTSFTGDNGWRKAGVMIRETLNANSTHVLMAVTGGNGNGVSMQWRPSAGSTMDSDHATSAQTMPHWVRLVRQGNTFTAYHSNDGVTWTQQHSRNITMGADVYIGIMASSHNTGNSAVATFTDVEVIGDVGN